MTTTTAPDTGRTRPLANLLPWAGDAARRAGLAVVRYGLALVLAAIGGLKFTAAEAEGVRGLIEHSPLLSWMYSVWSVRGASNVIGVTCSHTVSPVSMLAATTASCFGFPYMV